MDLEQPDLPGRRIRVRIGVGSWTSDGSDRQRDFLRENQTVGMSFSFLVLLVCFFFTVFFSPMLRRKEKLAMLGLIIVAVCGRQW